ncbi:hypothetical protein LX36DRAFT_484174 [Colletotrichum falcatum]|nr:hypothetical protein LX36DRAFT_484174 [Colletotrichum falcatum]
MLFGRPRATASRIANRPRRRSQRVPLAETEGRSGSGGQVFVPWLVGTFMWCIRISRRALKAARRNKPSTASFSPSLPPPSLSPPSLPLYMPPSPPLALHSHFHSFFLRPWCASYRAHPPFRHQTTTAACLGVGDPRVTATLFHMPGRTSQPAIEKKINHPSV